jgi:hypothetical protein
MPLILAIVADPHEAAQLAALIQGRLSVDLVQAAEVGEGLLALDDRIPDLILTSPLMSPFDDGVLDEYLRDLGPTGAHVQTLRIPVLSQAPKKKQRLGFSLRRRPKPENPALEGCEPKVFADEIEQYLVRAAEEKRHASANETPAIGREGSTDDLTPMSEVQWTPAYSPDPAAANVARSAPEAEPEPIAWRADLLEAPPAEDVEYETPIYQATSLESITEAVEPEPQSDVIAVASTPAPVEVLAPVGMLEEPAVEERVPVAVVAAIQLAALEEIAAAAAEEFAVVAEPAVVEAVTVVEVEPVRVATVETAATAFVEPKGQPEPAAASASAEAEEDAQKATPSFKAALAAIRAAWGKPSPSQATPAQSTREEAATTRLPSPRYDAIFDKKKPEMAAAEIPEPIEVDLTDAVDVLDEEPVGILYQAPAHQQPPAVPANVAREDISDVYELSIEADMEELESQLLTPLPPKPKRETAQAAASPAPPPIEPRKVEARPSAEPKGDRRKKSKRGEKAAVKVKAPQTQVQTQPQPPKAQDEWGIFDPNRCGFAALVDKLDKVSDEKPEQPPRTGSKTRVISYS